MGPERLAEIEAQQAVCSCMCHERVSELCAALREAWVEIDTLRAEARLDGLNVKRLHARLALAEAVAEAFDSYGCEEPWCSSRECMALKAWRAWLKQQGALGDGTPANKQ